MKTNENKILKNMPKHTTAESYHYYTRDRKNKDVFCTNFKLKKKLQFNETAINILYKFYLIQINLSYFLNFR